MTNLVPIGSGVGLSQMHSSSLEDSDDDDVMALLDDLTTSKKKKKLTNHRSKPKTVDQIKLAGAKNGVTGLRQNRNASFADSLGDNSDDNFLLDQDSSGNEGKQQHLIQVKAEQPNKSVRRPKESGFDIDELLNIANGGETNVTVPRKSTSLGNVLETTKQNTEKSSIPDKPANDSTDETHGHIATSYVYGKSRSRLSSVPSTTQRDSRESGRRQ